MNIHAQNAVTDAEREPKLAASDDPEVIQFPQRVHRGANSPNKARPSEDDLALKFASEYHDDYRYVPAWKSWLRWDGTRWAQDELMSIWEASRKLCRNESASYSGDKCDEVRQALGSRRVINNVAVLASSDPRMCVRTEDLDADPWALNTPSGIVDLRNGEIHPHERAKLHTKCTAASPGGKCPLWTKTLEEVLPDPDVRAYLQRLCGYALTGLSSEHVLPFFLGEGGNGKGVIANAFREAVGDYGRSIPSETLMERKSEKHETEMASFKGIRVAVSSEVDAGQFWNEARVKRLTGGDEIIARRMRTDFFEFKPTHTFFILANHKPRFRCVDKAIRRRAQLIAFPVNIAPKDQDIELPEKLRAEYGGILQWAIEGCRRWQEIGLAPPTAVREATEEYLDSEDFVEQWLHGVRDSITSKESLSNAYKHYVAWCERERVPFLERNSFAAALDARGVRRDEAAVRAKRGVFFFGIDLHKAAE